MQPEANQLEGYLAPLKKVTPLSKYLALFLFIILPFVGSYIGYKLAPERVLEIERVVQSEESLDGDIGSLIESDSKKNRTITEDKLIAESSNPYLAKRVLNYNPSFTSDYFVERNHLEHTIIRLAEKFSIPVDIKSEGNAVLKCSISNEHASNEMSNLVPGNKYGEFIYFGFRCLHKGAARFYFQGDVEVSGQGNGYENLGGFAITGSSKNKFPIAVAQTLRESSVEDHFDLAEGSVFFAKTSPTIVTTDMLILDVVTGGFQGPWHVDMNVVDIVDVTSE